MQLFSYQREGIARSARLVGELGIDLKDSAASYIKNNKEIAVPFDSLPDNLLDLLQLGEDGFKYSEVVTDWVLRNLHSDGVQLESGTVFQFSEAHLCAPIIRPGKIICIGGNYPAPGKMDEPEFPIVFLKPSGGIIGHNQPVILPPAAKSVSYEVELAVVIGRKGKNLTAEDVPSIIGGYTIANDLGDRKLEKRTSQWTSGKMFDTFSPLGPILKTPDELPDVSNLNMYTIVNDQFVQKGNTSQMFFDVTELIVYLSTLTTLEPGDIILTGSPKIMDEEPNPPYVLEPGDIVEAGIENLASLINPITSE